LEFNLFTESSARKSQDNKGDWIQRKDVCSSILYKVSRIIVNEALGKDSMIVFGNLK